MFNLKQTCIVRSLSETKKEPSISIGQLTV